MNIPEESLTGTFYQMTYTVGPHQQGLRLDAFLKERYSKRSREKIQRAIAEGAITLERNQSPHLHAGRLKPSLQLFPGDRILVRSERKPEPDVNFDYKIIHEDEALFVIEKPANLPVHPAGRYFFNTLLTHLRTGGHTRPLDADHDYYLAHRLDKETSGILILTKTPAACTHITKQFSERQTTKHYLAIAHGHIANDVFTVDAPLRRAQNSLIDVRMEPTTEAEGGQTAQTDFKVLSRHSVNVQGVMRAFSLVACAPKTGRQHQIRVHLEHAGHPIVGDKLYGMPADEAYAYFERKHLSAEALARLILPRHALHAAGIEFKHPLTGQKMKFESPLPAELAEFLNPKR